MMHESVYMNYGKMKTVDEWRKEGDALKDLEKFEESLVCYEKVLEINPRDTIAWLGKAWAFVGLVKFKDGISSYNYVIEIDPKNASAWYHKGEALNLLEMYMEIDSDIYKEDISAALEYISELDITVKAVKPPAAEELPGHLKVKANEVALTVVFPSRSRAAGYCFEEAIKCCDEKIGIDPKNIETWDIVNH